MDAQRQLPTIKGLPIETLLKEYVQNSGVQTTKDLGRGVPEKRYVTTAYVLMVSTVLFPSQTTKKILHKQAVRLLSKIEHSKQQHLSVFVMTAVGLRVLELFSDEFFGISDDSKLYTADRWLNENPDQKQSKLSAM